jgi:hypothetical protein
VAGTPRNYCESRARSRRVNPRRNFPRCRCRTPAALAFPLVAGTDAPYASIVRSDPENHARCYINARAHLSGHSCGRIGGSGGRVGEKAEERDLPQAGRAMSLIKLATFPSYFGGKAHGGGRQSGTVSLTCLEFPFPSNSRYIEFIAFAFAYAAFVHTTRPKLAFVGRLARF